MIRAWPAAQLLRYTHAHTRRDPEALRRFPQTVKPHLTNENGIRWDLGYEARFTIREMRRDTHSSVTTFSHTKKGLLDPWNDPPLPDTASCWFSRKDDIPTRKRDLKFKLAFVAFFGNSTDANSIVDDLDALDH